MKDAGEPDFLILDYVTITRDPRTQLVVTSSCTPEAAGILEVVGRFREAPGPRGPFHRQPHDLPVEQQRHYATAAAQALLLAGFSVFLDPSLNTLAAPEGDRAAAHRYLDHLTERAREATDDKQVAEILAEVAAPTEGLLSHLVQTLITTWATWSQRTDGTLSKESLSMRLMGTTSGLSRGGDEIRYIRNQAAAAKPAAPQPPAPPGPAASPPTRGR
ncbi:MULTISPECIES: hypothetical protein [Streptomyces]|uniref:hypothetical protein n=1 Tax=Streptomyces TaxID=1883 RepID=UPI00226FF25A|nr:MULTISPECIES: hypothetical protein [unclassified Streptomyces]MCY0940249.1 hypothetical protein [Streptomyces sp. H34-AA3]MCZ4080896.1 hypothetical protein [Streptomyces sp. H34-S5]